MPSPRPLVPILCAVGVIAVLGAVVALVYAGRHAPPLVVVTVVQDPVATARKLSERMQNAITSHGDLTLILPDAKTLADKNPKCFEAQLLLGQLYIALNRYDLAYGPARQALNLRPLGSELAKLLGTLAANTERLDEAEQLYRQALDKSPRSRERGMVYAMLGSVLRQKNKLDEADGAYASAIGDDAFLIPAHTARAELALLRHDTQAALDRIEEGTTWAASDPQVDQTPLLVMKARVLLALGKTDDAYRLLMTEVAPEKRLTLLTADALAQVWEKQGKPAKAAVYYEGVLAELQRPLGPDERPPEKTDANAKQAQIKEARAQAARWWRLAGNEEAAKKYE